MLEKFKSTVKNYPVPVIKKFMVEIDEAGVVFSGAKDDPPLAANLPPISGAIYWSNDIEKDLNLTLKSLSRVDQVTQHSSWPAALAHFNTFIATLHSYKVRNGVTSMLREGSMFLSILDRTL